VEGTRPLVAVVNDEAVFAQLVDAVLHDEGYDTLLLQTGEVAYTGLYPFGRQE
jgi:CheY-like chemotaxis protein